MKKILVILLCLLVVSMVFSGCIDDDKYLVDPEEIVTGQKDFTLSLKKGDEIKVTVDLKEGKLQTKETRQLADSPWPCFRGNAQNTGLSLSNTDNNPGMLNWKFKTRNNVFSSPAIGSDDMIYVGSYNDLYAINSNGTLNWMFKTQGSVDSSPAISSDGTIYIGSYDSYLYAIKPDGIEKWKFKTGGYVLPSPAIGSDGTIYVGSYDSYLYAINSNGTLKWKFKAGGGIPSSPAIDSEGTLYIGSWDNFTYAINPNGSLKWKFKTENWVCSSPTIGPDGTIYVGSNDDNIYAINPNGSLKWQFETGNAVVSSPAVGSDGTIYAGSNDDNIYAINPNGTLRWKYKTGDDVVSSPGLGSDGTIYVGSYDNCLYAINPNGSLKWKFKTQGDVESSPAITLDTIYFGSRDDYLYAIGNGTTLPLSAHDLQAFVGDSYVNLSWQRPSDDGGSPITKFKIYRGVNSSDKRFFDSVGSFNVYYNDSMVTNGITYYYYVTVVNSVGESDPSNEVSATPYDGWSGDGDDGSRGKNDNKTTEDEYDKAFIVGFGGILIVVVIAIIIFGLLWRKQKLGR